MSKYKAEHEASSSSSSSSANNHQPVRNDHKVGRNDLCPCGSGLKYKNCHGKHQA